MRKMVLCLACVVAMVGGQFVAGCNKAAPTAPTVQRALFYEDGGSIGLVLEDEKGNVHELVVDGRMATETLGGIFLGSIEPDEGRLATEEEFDRVAELAHDILRPHDLSRVYNPETGLLIAEEISPEEGNLIGVAELLRLARFPPEQRTIEFLDGGGSRTTHPNGVIEEQIPGWGWRLIYPDGRVEEYSEGGGVR